MFTTTSDVSDALGKQQYIASDEIATVLFLAEKLGKPVLAEGPAGVGKTELAKAWAAATGRKLIRLQCYEGLDETKALYEWEYAKQMLYTQLLRDKLGELLVGATSLSQAADRLGEEDDVFFSKRFLLPRPLLSAIISDEPVALLVDAQEQNTSHTSIALPAGKHLRKPPTPVALSTPFGDYRWSAGEHDGKLVIDESLNVPQQRVRCRSWAHSWPSTGHWCC